MQSVPQSLIGAQPSGGDDTATLNAILASGSLHLAAGTFLISSALTVPSNAVITAAPGAILQGTTAGQSLLNAAGASGVVIRGVYLKLATGDGTSATAGVNLTGSSDCKVEGCTFDGLQWAGVLLDGAARCRVAFCYFKNWQGTIQDAADVMIRNVATENVVEANWCFGGGEHGIAIMDPYTVVPNLPQRNLVAHNQIGAHTGYGVLVYMPARASTFNATISGTAMTVQSVTAGTIAVGQHVTDQGTGVNYGYIISGSGLSWTLDTSSAVGSSTAMAGGVSTTTQNRVIGNQIRDISGTYVTNTQSGAGVYVVGDGAGGTLVANNEIANCCISTTSRTLAPAGIGISNAPPSVASVVVSGNVISGMTQYDGITITGCLGGAVVSGNSIVMPSGNTTGYGISVWGNGAKSDISGNRVLCLNGQAAILLFASGGTSIDGAVVANNLIDHTSGIAIQVTQTSSGTLNDVVITGNRAKTTNNTPTPFSIQAVARLALANNTVYSGTQPALALTNCTSARITGNVFVSNGSTAVTLAGTNTSGSFDESNMVQGAIANSGTGLMVRQLGTAAPATGTYAIGDTVINTAPAATASTDKWRCTTAGTPGTWTAQSFP